jgi:hypothetical protein
MTEAAGLELCNGHTDQQLIESRLFREGIAIDNSGKPMKKYNVFSLLVYT